MVIWEVFSTIYNIFLYTDFFYTILEEKTKEQGVPKLIKKRDCIVNIYLLLASITQRRNSFFFFLQIILKVQVKCDNMQKAIQRNHCYF